MKAIKRGNDFNLNGTKLFVPDAQNADYIIVAARSSEVKNAPDG